MAPSTKDQEDYISTAIQIAMDTAMARIDNVLGEVKSDHDAMKTYIETYQTELVANSLRVSNLVDDANKKADALRESMAQIEKSKGQISETESKLEELIKDLNEFTKKQAETMESQRTTISAANSEVENLSLDMKSASNDLDARILAAVEHCKATALADVQAMKVELNTWSIGVKTGINQLADAIRNGGGGGGVQQRLPEGKGSGAGIGKKGGRRVEAPGQHLEGPVPPLDQRDGPPTGSHSWLEVPRVHPKSHQEVADRDYSGSVPGGYHEAGVGRHFVG